MHGNMNPLDDLGIKREHIKALREAYTQTNKKSSSKRAARLLALFEILQDADYQRGSLYWDYEESSS
jgi:hypothetical protein